MQIVLSIDATLNPPIGVVAEVEGNSIRVIERKELIFDTELSLQNLLNPELKLDPAVTPPSHPLDFETEFTSALVIIPPVDYLSASLSLPFGDTKQLDKIIDSEMQDLVPFDTSEFILQHRTVGSRGDGAFDVHVSAMPRQVVRNTLTLCNSRGIDPIVLTTPASILQVVAVLDGDPERTTLYSYISEHFTNIAVCHGGKIILDRAIDRSAPYTNGSHGGALSPEALLYRIKLELSAIERKIGRSCDALVFVDSVIDAAALERAIERPVKLLTSASLMNGVSGQTGLATMGAWLAEDSRVTGVLTNFRVGEFSFRPPLKEIIGALRILAPYILFAIALAVAYCGADYLITNYEIDALNASVANQVKSVASEIKSEDSDPLKALSKEINKIEDELKDLGSPESYSPLESLALLSSFLPNIPDVTIDKLNIRANKITFEGCAPDYQSIESIENALNREPSLSSVKKSAVTCSSGRPSGRGFKFELWERE